LNYQNNYVTLKPVARILKFFIALLIIFKIPIKLFWWFKKIIFRSVSSKILDLVSDITNSRVSDSAIRIGSAYTSIRLTRIGQRDNTCRAIGSRDYNHFVVPAPWRSSHHIGSSLHCVVSCAHVIRLWTLYFHSYYQPRTYSFYFMFVCTNKL